MSAALERIARIRGQAPPRRPAILGHETETCAHGHLWTDENTHIDREGVRRCRECRRETVRRSRQKARAAS